MPSNEKIKLLITGFGPFPGVHANPSADLLRLIEGRRRWLPPAVELKLELIPTHWESVESFTAGKLAEFDPDIALHFGVHSRTKALRLETIARNTTGTRADASGKTAKNHYVIKSAPRSLVTALEAGRLVTKLRACGLPAQSSTDAGRYLCNAVFFASLNQAIERSLPRQTGFIHIPTLDQPGMDRAALLNAADIIIGHSIARHTRRCLLGKVMGG